MGYDLILIVQILWVLIGLSILIRLYFLVSDNINKKKMKIKKYEEKLERKIFDTYKY